ncbi:hypothetical protein PoB_003459200 [Plakobranchus ocellatus]|uniref:Uncharacterized protein n=1 Tax=Plakobranchus ocellatus TaxID=259542 RepID=A0AAV4AM83_9GAST|nr:hypothetical protein PoB_003459200 [Plakobranchus ocellatus]
MAEDKMKEKFDVFKRPENCPSLAVRLTNKDVWNMLKCDNKKFDAIFSAVQRLISKAVTAIAFSAKKLKECKEIGVKKAMSHSSDAIALLGSAQQIITAQRKMTQKPALPYDIRDICHLPRDGTAYIV